MNNAMVHPDQHAVKGGRFVAASEEEQEQFERELGRNLFKRGKPLRECRTDYMAAGWLAAEFAGYMAYSRQMEAEGVPAAQAFAFQGWEA